MTLSALAHIVSAIESVDLHPSDIAGLQSTRDRLAFMDASEATALWMVLASHLGRMSFEALTKVRERIDAMDGPDRATASYWFTWGVWHHRVEQGA